MPGLYSAYRRRDARSDGAGDETTGAKIPIRVYYLPDFQGPAYTISIDAHFVTVGAWWPEERQRNDNIQIRSIEAPAGACYTLYKFINFEGTRRRFCGSIRDTRLVFEAPNARGSFISSIRLG